MNNVSAVTDEALVASLKTLVARERVVVADIIEHLAEVARRKLYITSACTSLFAYCHEVLGYNEDIARPYVTVVYVVLEHPMVLDMLRAGTLNVSGVRLLAPALEGPGAEAKLEAAAGKTRNELERLLVSWKPKELVPSEVKELVFDNKQERLAWATNERAVETATLDVPPPPRAPMPKPLTARHYEVRCTLEEEAHADLMRLRDLTRHIVPDGDVAKVIAYALKVARKAVEKRKLGRSDKPKQLPIDATKTERAPDPGRAPSAQTRREVSERDHDQCTYVSAEGKRCSATAWIEFDHKIQVAAGGDTRTNNLRLYCRVHNAARNYPTRPGAHPQ